jgi:hypothetical protein
VIERVTRDRITFPKPFLVEGLGRELPAGSYEIESVEELIEGLSFLAYRTASTSILLPLSSNASGSYQVVRVEPSVIRTALRDADEQVMAKRKPAPRVAPAGE